MDADLGRRRAPPATRPRWSARPRRWPQALLDYVDLGATTLLIRGYDPLDDAVDYGRHLLPLVRQELAHRERTAPAPPSPSEPAR